MKYNIRRLSRFRKSNQRSVIVCEQCRASVSGQLRVVELKAAHDLLKRLERDQANGRYAGDLKPAQQRVRDAERELEAYHNSHCDHMFVGNCQ